ncbi:uncharacterized protein LOC124459912 [Drosophila willistoni]|uniref:uncharacterized protein LOC124459912 n=1 Tax=Drosophila willistoni TaxID=7260 RepID=UPI00017D9EF6|nr:uncharacterized protein LOC124459912 [Drosophila willistoni]
MAKDWLATAGLELAVQKTEDVLISSRKTVANIIVDATTITSTRAIRYLGIHLDPRLTFKEHLELVGARAAELGRSLSRIMLNSRGPKQGRRLLLMNVMKSTMFYGAPAWAKAMTVKTYRRRLDSTYRLAALWRRVLLS